MKQLKELDSLCDVTLSVGEESFRVHRVVLAASSPYFNAMFTNQHLESSMSRVELNGMDAGALKSLIDFAYTSVLTICEETVQALLIAANLLQITSVVDACSDFLSARVDVENCLEIAAFAELFSCSHLYRTSWQFALENFHEVWQMEEFLSTPLSLLLDLVKSENLRIQSEEEVLESVLCWYMHDEVGRLGGVLQVLQHVRLPLIPWGKLSDKILSLPALSSDPQCQILLENARSLRQSRSKVLGMESTSSSQCIPRRSVGQNMFLYVVGGETAPGRSTVATVEQFNPNKNTWHRLASMATSRRGIGMSLLNGLLYVVGGSDGLQALR